MKYTWRVWGTAAASLAMLELAVIGRGCGGSSASPDGTVVTNEPAVDVSGGTASSPGGQGQAGGVVHLIATGDVTIDTTATAMSPSVPAVPMGVTTIDAAALGADVSAPGSAVISGSVTSGGGEAIRKISANGDLFVTGTLRAADLGGGRQGLDLNATGTLYVTGAIDASGAAGGQAGGAITLSASQIVITGKLMSSGGDGDTAGGAAGAIAMTSMADVSISGPILVRGGAASGTSAGAAQGGAAATFTVDASGAVDLGAAIDARGGLATAKGAGGSLAGGAAGTVRIGEKTPPASIMIRVPVIAMGGAGDTMGGQGGTFTAEPGTGTINVNGTHALDVSGGDAAGTPGAGGLVNGSPRSDPGAGGFHVGGEIAANGGSVVHGGSGNGAEGGRVDIELIPTDGAVMVDQSGKITADGGKAGSGVAGGGGHIWLFTMDGDLTIAGSLSARGGEASDGTGGLGGMIYLFSDDNHNAVDVGKGNLLIAPSGVLNASGGDGNVGGDARNDGIMGQVAPFPEEQEKFAIFLNCDGQHGETRNWMDNQGMLIARGGAPNGNGGDITYHGIGPGQRDMPTDDSGNHHPPGGNQDMSGDGSGQAGDYGAE